MCVWNKIKSTVTWNINILTYAIDEWFLIFIIKMAVILHNNPVILDWLTYSGGLFLAYSYFT